MDRLQIDVRPIPIDKMASFSEEELASRQVRVAELLSIYTEYVELIQKDLTDTMSLRDYLQEEAKNVALAQLLKKGDVVRVVCPTCKGSGLKPTDVTTGRVSSLTGSAFETVKGARPQKPEDDPRLQCTECQGAKWVIMERYRG